MSFFRKLVVVAVGATAVVATIYVARKWRARRDVSPDDHGNSAAIAEVEVVPSSVVQIAEEPVEIEGPIEDFATPFEVEPSVQVEVTAAVDPETEMDVASVPEEAGEEEGAVGGPVEIVAPHIQEVNNEQQGAKPKRLVRKSKRKFQARQKERQEMEAAAKLAATFESPSLAEVELAPSVQVEDAAAVDPETEMDPAEPDLAVAEPDLAVAEPETIVSELEVVVAAAEVAVIAAELAVAEPDLAVAAAQVAVTAAQAAVDEPEVARAVAEAAVAAAKAAIAAVQVAAAPEIDGR